MDGSQMDGSMNDFGLDDDLLARYLSGTASEGDIARVRAWAGDSLERRRELEFLATVWRRSPGALVRGDVDAVWGRVVHRTSRTPRYKVVAIPLAIAAALTIGFFAIKYIPNLTNTIQSTTPQTKTYATTTGQRANVTLFDGSQVILAPATTMIVTGRNVDLKGEAVFTVTQHAGDPFIVKTGNTVTRVLGTRFGVRSYDSEVRVSVSDGKVVVGQGASLAARPQDAILSANDIATIRDGQTTITRNTDVSALLSWTQGRLVFDNTPTSQVIAELRRWYNIDFKVHPNLSERHVTASLELAPISNVLDVLAPALGARYERNGRVVTLF